MAHTLYLFVFLRHGESEGNARGIHQGQADFPLTARGRAQVEDLGAAWRARRVAFDGILSSPLKRAAESAQIIARSIGFPLEDIAYDDIWKERDKGVLTGRPFSQRHGQPSLSLYHPVGENGESRWEVHQRAMEAVRRLLARPPGRYLVVSHGGILNSIFHTILGIPPQPYQHAPSFRIPNASYLIFTYQPIPHRWAILNACHREDGLFPCV